MVFESQARTARDFINAKAAARQAVEQSASHDDWADDDRTEWEPAPYHRVRVRRLVDDKSDDALFSLVWERPHADPDLRTQTEVLVGREGNRGWVVVREAIGSVNPTLTPPVLTPTAPPDVVRRLVDKIAFEDANCRLSSSAEIIGVDRVPEIDYFVSSGRRLPVVVLSDDGTRKMTKIAGGLAQRLVGLAHVVALDSPAATVAFNHAIGVNHIVPNTGARIYWPRFRGSKPEQNRRWGPSEVMSSAGTVEPGFITSVVRMIFDAGALRVPDPPLVQRLEAARIRQMLAERRAERAVVIPEINQVSRAELEAHAEKVFEEWADATAELERFREHLARVEADRDRVQEDYDRVRDQWVAQASNGVVGPLRSTEPLVVVIQRAKKDLSNLVVLDTALTSAKRWQFDRTNEVWGALLMLDYLAGEWAAGTLNESFGESARQKGLDWASGISETSKRKFSNDYQRTFEGRPVMLGPHLRMSGGRQLLRIYFALDEVPGQVGELPKRRLLIGHVGEHLRTQADD